MAPLWDRASLSLYGIPPRAFSPEHPKATFDQKLFTPISEITSILTSFSNGISLVDHSKSPIIYSLNLSLYTVHVSDFLLKGTPTV